MDAFPNATTPSSYTGWIDWTSTQTSTKSKARASSCASAKTIDEVGEDMPEMQICDGKCGQMLLVSQMTKLHCAHIFCTKCLPECQKEHSGCVRPVTKNVIKQAKIERALSKDGENKDSKAQQRSSLSTPR